MESKQQEIICPCDLYARKASNFRNAVVAMGGNVRIEKIDEGRWADASSLIGLLSLGVNRGDRIRLISTNPKADPRAVAECLN